MTRELRIVVGIPASGKSTFIHQEMDRLVFEGYTVGAISRDVIRFCMLGEGEEYFAHEKEVFKEFVRQINEAMEVGIDVVFADATHISPASRSKLLSHLRPDPNTSLVFEVMDTPVAECLNRNVKRKGRARVPNIAIHNMAKDFRKPTMSEFPDTFGFKDITINTYTYRR